MNPKKIYLLLFLVLSASFIHYNAYTQIVINEYSVSNLSSFPDNYSEYEDWFELYNTTAEPIAVGGYNLSDNPDNPIKWQIPAGTVINANGFLRFWASGRNTSTGGHFHTSFRLSQTKSNAEYIVFSSPFGVIIDQVQLQITQKAHSHGRFPNGSPAWVIYTSPTPNATNDNAQHYSRYTDKPMMSLPAGFHAGPVKVAISTTEPNGVIRYTMDGNEPVATSPVYTDSIQLTQTEIIKARTFSDNADYLPGLIEFNTYLINENITLPVISVAANQMQQLLNGNSALKPNGSIEFFNKEGVRTNIGYGDFNEHGQDSWVHPQRSIDYISRDECGYNYALREKFFSLSDRDEFQRVILRASGDDNYPGIDTSAHMRDDYVQTISNMSGQYLDWRRSERCVIFANGDFWGIYAIREKTHDHDYTEYYYDQGKFDIQYIMHWGGTWAEYGGQQALNDWQALWQYINSNNMSDPEKYEYVASQLDIRTLVDYIIINSYVVCSDWINWNVAWWRGMNPDGDHKKWGYTLWDEDATFGHYINYTGVPGQNPYVSPCFPQNITADPVNVVKILNKLRVNPTFNQYYVTRYIDLMNTGFRRERMIAVLDSMANIIEPEMEKHTQRWGGSVEEWRNNVLKVRNFVAARHDYFPTGWNSCQNLNGPYSITVDTDPPEIGKVFLNSLSLTTFPWTGKYHGGIPTLLHVEVLNSNYEFDRWVLNNHTVTPNDTTNAITLTLTTTDTIVAVFRPKIAQDTLVINEINYNSAQSFDPGDWVELYNPHPYTVNAGGWVFKDEDDEHSFEIPEDTEIEPYGYLVICTDTDAFTALFPEVLNYTGPTEFGLNGSGELIRLYNPDGVLIDTVHYDDQLPWPIEPDGEGATLELILPEYDNALAESWTASPLHGTPGTLNSTMVGVNEPQQPNNRITLKIIPNPVSHSAWIGADIPLHDGDLTILNSYGKVVRTFENISADFIDFQRESLPAGLYFITYVNKVSNITGTCKLIIH